MDRNEVRNEGENTVIYILDKDGLVAGSVTVPERTWYQVRLISRGFRKPLPKEGK